MNRQQQKLASYLEGRLSAVRRLEASRPSSSLLPLREKTGVER